MSKASEWAARADALNAEIRNLEERRGELDFRLEFTDDGKKGCVHAFVVEDGPMMHLGAYDATLTPEQALDLARWILATFSDEPHS